ncbi:MAG TPA: tetratricopeptide repeat protein [Pyrinomonadaceae bacterium]|jgi:tetratricopeptide (TPR) repeat protein|nr:tetratricopeptide repeat protein [Pyrinomonadaceae bacterium]
MKRGSIYTRTAVALLFILLTSPGTLAQEKVVAVDALTERLERAAALISSNRIEEAEQQLNSVLKVRPSDPVAFNLLGTIRAKQGRLDEAEAFFSRAIRIDNQLLGAHMNLAYLYLLRGAPEKTALELKEVLRLDPNNTDASHRLAWLLLSQGRFDECISFIEKVKATHALTAPLMVMLGDAYSKKGEFEKAEGSYLAAINEQGNNADALLGLARVRQARGDAENAALYLRRAKDVLADSPDQLYRFALAALNSDLIDDAMRAVKRAVELKPDEPVYYFVLGIAWLRAKKPDLQEAEGAFRQFLKARPDDSQGQLNLGYVLLKQKRYEEARVELERSVQKTSATPEGFYYLGLIAQEQNEDERAVELFEKAIQLLPSYAYAHIALGSLYLKLKNYGRAQAELEIGVKLSPDDSKAHYNLAMLYARQKQQQRAQEEMRIVERLKSEGKAETEEDGALLLAPPGQSPR